MFVPNPSYPGPVSPRLAEFEELGFLSDTAEYQALEAGSGIDVGYIPPQDVPPNTGSPLHAGPNAPALHGRYQLDPLYGFQVSYFPLNFENPTVGAIFSQLYARQALQSLIDQPGYIKAFDAGYGVPTNGPVPAFPPTYASPAELHNPYPYSVSTAGQLLAGHGWTVVPGGQSYCSDPGTGSNQCGAGIADGQPFSFSLLLPSTNTTLMQEMQQWSAAALQDGIDITLQPESFIQVLKTASLSCFVTGDCSWTAADWAGGWTFSPDYLPTGEEIFDGVPGCSSASQVAIFNAGSYCDPTNHANIELTLHTGGLAPILQYENYLAPQLPVLWQPVAATRLTEVNKHLRGVLPQNDLGGLTPENWSWQRGFGHH